MKKIIILILTLLMAQSAYANNMEVRSGYGYIKDLSGNVVTKCRLTPGVYPIKNGYKYIEVNSLAELNAIEVYVEPPDPNIEKNYKKNLLKTLNITEADLTKLKALP